MFSVVCYDRLRYGQIWYDLVRPGKIYILAHAMWQGPHDTMWQGPHNAFVETQHTVYL